VQLIIKKKWVTINIFMNKKLKYFFEIGFDSKIKKKNYLILALKYAHIARRSRY
jgi:hypothetical protein